MSGWSKSFPERRLDSNPICQVGFALHNIAVEPPRLTGLSLELIQSETLRVRFDLELHAREQDQGIEFYWVYNSDLFDRWRIEQMAAHYLRLLALAGSAADHLSIA